MKEKIKSIFDDLIKSFNTTNDGFSGKKISACVSVITAITLSAKYTEKDVLVEVITVWLLFASACFGINEWGKKNNKPPIAQE